MAKISQNASVTLSTSGGTWATQEVTYNNLHSIQCSGSGGSVHIKTYTGSVIDNNDIVLFFPSLSIQSMDNVDIPIASVLEVTNLTPQDATCTMIINNFEHNTRQAEVQDYWLAIINFLVLLLLYVLPFLYFYLIVKRKKDNKNTPNNPKNA